MNASKSRYVILIAAALFAGVADAQSAKPASSAQAAQSAVVSDFTEGEVRKVDKSANKITLRHGEIKSLDMPAMTMVFVAARAELLEQVKAGDKVRFRASNSGGAFTVTDIEATR